MGETEEEQEQEQEDDEWRGIKDEALYLYA